MDPHVFIASVVTGVTCSLTTLAVVWLAREIWFWLMYRPFQAQYDVYCRAGARRGDEVIEVAYQGGRRLLFRSFVFSSAHQQWLESWDSMVTMRLDQFWCGDGLFEYKQFAGAGTHTVKLNRAQRSILVVGENVAGGETSVPFSFVLKRRVERINLAQPDRVGAVG